MSTVSFNGTEYSEESVAAARLALNDVKLRETTDFRNALGRQFDGERRVYDTLGYPEEPTLSQYRSFYERGDIAERIVSLPAQDTWRHPPEITDTDGGSAESTSQFESDLEQLTQSVKPWQYLRRTDTIAGIGEFGVLFLGVEGDTPLNEAIEPGSLSGSGPESIEFFQPFAQDSVEDWQLGKELGQEPTNPRYNKPVIYELDFSTLDESDQDLHDVHYTRLLHVPAGPRDESELKAEPRLKSVLNRLIDLEKTVGASAEMFWFGADRKMHFDIDSENSADIPSNELADLNDEVQKLVHDMQSYIKTFNTDINVLEGDDPDPSGIVDEILKFIAGAKGIPKRILTGSERGELASSQDRATWFGRVETRQNSFVEPVIVRPLIDMLVEYGVLSPPQGGTFDVEWANLFELTELETAEVEATRSTVIKNTPGVALTAEQVYEYITEGTAPDFEEQEAPEPLPGSDEVAQSLVEEMEDAGLRIPDELDGETEQPMTMPQGGQR